MAKADTTEKATAPAEGTVDGGEDGNQSAPQAVDLTVLAQLLGEQIAGALAPIRQELDSLKSQVTQQADRAPQFRKQESDGDRDSVMAARRRAFNEAMANKGSAISGTAMQIPVGTHGQRLNEHLQQAFPQRYRPGDTVFINPEVTKERAGRTWGDVLSGIGCSGEGVVRKSLWLTKFGQWKYIVRVKGLTKPEGDGFHDYELMAG